MRGRSWKFWLVAGVLVLGVGVIGGPFIYIHIIEAKAPAPLSLAKTSPPETPTTSTATSIQGVDGTWTVTSGSTVGYRVQEVLFGQSHTAAGRTSAVTVDMTTVASDQQRRDNQFNGRIMDTASYPTATFKLSSPIVLTSIPSVGMQASAQATGVLTMHGTSKSVTFTLTGQRTGVGIQVTGQIPITFADWNIPNPSFGPVTTQDHGVLEFLLVFKRA